ncbi:hypothetical protein [Curtobacterium sp. 20TX0008]|uniref:hypothetical protein n=1 Tax=Curtobacterium sp. 20TX0008 TaxID=3022018 RepID=UPI00233067FC|nr:hypothetical protein [Curtobacterium sp. 20TX0008]MDB6425849.1 hypothetical protein [Curtobacterium sp. 20TX0008]
MLQRHDGQDGDLGSSASAAAEREADDVLAGMAAAMGTTVQPLPEQVRIGVRSSILGRVFSG